MLQCFLNDTSFKINITIGTMLTVTDIQDNQRWVQYFWMLKSIIKALFCKLMSYFHHPHMRFQNPEPCAGKWLPSFSLAASDHYFLVTNSLEVSRYTTGQEGMEILSSAVLWVTSEKLFKDLISKISEREALIRFLSYSSPSSLLQLQPHI